MLSNLAYPKKYHRVDANGTDGNKANKSNKETPQHNSSLYTLTTCEPIPSHLFRIHHDCNTEFYVVCIDRIRNLNLDLLVTRLPSE